MHLGSKVDFVDVGEDFNINLKSLENKLKSKKKYSTVLTSVHLQEFNRPGQVNSI